MTEGPTGDAARKPTTLADLGPRLASGIVMIVLALGALYAGGPVFVAFWLVAGLAVHWEWQRLIGGAKLWPRVSPSKTWSGFLIGISSGALLGLAALSIYAVQIFPVPLILLGLLVGAISQGGDLFESSLKRHFNVKDSSHLIPGHGGFMDRLDGFLAAASFAAAFGTMKAGAAAAAHGLFIW